MVCPNAFGANDVSLTKLYRICLRFSSNMAHRSVTHMGSLVQKQEVAPLPMQMLHLMRFNTTMYIGAKNFFSESRKQYPDVEMARELVCLVYVLGASTCDMAQCNMASAKSCHMFGHPHLNVGGSKFAGHLGF